MKLFICVSSWKECLIYSYVLYLYIKNDNSWKINVIYILKLNKTEEGIRWSQVNIQIGFSWCLPLEASKTSSNFCYRMLCFKRTAFTVSVLCGTAFINLCGFSRGRKLWISHPLMSIKSKSQVNRFKCSGLFLWEVSYFKHNSNYFVMCYVWSKDFLLNLSVLV